MTALARSIASGFLAFEVKSALKTDEEAKALYERMKLRIDNALGLAPAGEPRPAIAGAADAAKPSCSGSGQSGCSGKGGVSDPGDVAVIVLDQSPGITPASLPTAGLLDELKASHVLKNTRFTAVGYGTVRVTNTTGFQGILDNLDRNRVEQGYHSLTKAWLTLPMTLTTGDGGTCYGDSGGPHFIHLDGVETDIVVSITVTGDAPCVATDKTYRMDTASARNFLANFVDLP